MKTVGPRALWGSAGLAACAALALAAGIRAERAVAAGLLKPGALAEEVIGANNRGASLMEQFKHAQAKRRGCWRRSRSEEHTSELQSR